MSSTRSYVTVFFALFAFVLVSSITAVAQQTDVKIKNFGQMDDRFYRGAQPKEEDYKIDHSTLHLIIIYLYIMEQ